MNKGLLACVVVVALAALWWFDPFRIGWRKPVGEIAAADVAAIRQAPEVKAADGDWPWWRGPERNGIASGATPPAKWSEDENVLWKVAVPGRGHASPIVVGDKVLLASADAAEQTMLLLAHGRDDGKLLWQTEIHKGGFLGMHPKNSHASATPACDGELIFTAFAVQDHLWVTAVNLKGEIAWQEKAGPFVARHGFGSSPVLYRSLVIVAGDNLGTGYVAALDRKSGALVWRKSRGTGDSYGTPIVGVVGGREQLLLGGQNTVYSYDPASGDVLWHASGPADVTANTIAFDKDHVFASGGYPQQAILCLTAEGSVAWQKREKVYVPSMLASAGRLFVVPDGGVAECYDAGSGKKLWDQRLGGAFSASPTLVGDLLFVPNEDGKVFVVQTKPEFKVIAQNSLGEACYATPTICGGRLYLRGENHLFCIGTK